MRGAETILVVDDEEVILGVLDEWLTLLGYQVITANGAVAALEIFRGRPNGIDLVILDMIMPGMGGGEVLDRLKALNPDVAVILSSGYSVEGEASRIMDRGVRAFIQKPFQMKEFSRLIREVLDGDGRPGAGEPVGETAVRKKRLENDGEKRDGFTLTTETPRGEAGFPKGGKDRNIASVEKVVSSDRFSDSRPRSRFPGESPAGDDEARRSDTLSLYLENDLFGFDNKDRYYTHGTKLSWISRDLSDSGEASSLPLWIRWVLDRVPLINGPEIRRSVSFSLGQNIYTPEDKERSDLIPDDRPYAGVTYLGLGFHGISGRRMDTLEVDVGIVGRHSYAEDCQKVIHDWIGSVAPKGWEHQLKDEPILNLFFERKWRLLKAREAGGLGFDASRTWDGAAGNAYTGVNLGGQVRFGWNVPNDFGDLSHRPGSDSSAPEDDGDPRFFRPLHRVGVHVFLGSTETPWPEHLLDGNTFRESHSVDRKPFVAQCTEGSVILHRFKITYSYVYRTKEFETQKEGQQFGAITVSCTF